MELLIRDATESDAAAVQAIYAHHVLHGTASYDLEPPPVETIRDKIRWVRAGRSSWPRRTGSSPASPTPRSFATAPRIGSLRRTASMFIPTGWAAGSARLCSTP